MSDPHVLVVDDEELIGEYVAKIVEEIGTTDVFVYSDPTEVGDRWFHQLPDLLITDFQMPEMTGVELIEAFRAAHPDSPVPIIVVTADAQRDTRNSALAAGASEFLRKPVDRDEVRIRVRNMLALREGQRAAERRAEDLQMEVASATASLSSTTMAPASGGTSRPSRMARPAEGCHHGIEATSSGRPSPVRSGQGNRWVPR